MKKFIKLFVVATIVTSLAVPAMSQNAGPKGGGNGAKQGGQGGQRGAGMGQRMTKMEDEVFAKLNLNDKQKASIKKLRETRDKDMKALMGDMKPGQGQGPDPANREKMQKIQQTYRKGLMAVLTPDQQKKYEELMKAAREKAGQNRGERGGPRSGAGGAGNSAP